ncbi:MCE family protein [Nocardioides sp. W3-2-3]|nr:MCE family protein [Nocardioides convexus]
MDGPTYPVTVEFTDALNLPVDAPVRLDGATVGQVTSVEAGEYVAEVEARAVHLGAAAGRLAGGDPADLPDGNGVRAGSSPAPRAGCSRPARRCRPVRPGSAPDVTDLLSSLSTVVTGGELHRHLHDHHPGSTPR